MTKKIRKEILNKLLKPIANTEDKLENKADRIFVCLIKNKIISNEDRTCFITEFFKYISQISDDLSKAFDKAVMKALEKLNISIEDEAEENKSKERQ